MDAFRPLDRIHRRPWPVRLGRGLLAVGPGPADGGRQRRPGHRVPLPRRRPVAVHPAGRGADRPSSRVVGLGVFGWHLVGRRASRSSSPAGSYALGAAVLLGLNVLALACHELGHALATKHAGRRVPAAGFLVYFGIPSVFVDTTDVWMAGRRARLLTTAAGPAAGLVLAGAAAAGRACRPGAGAVELQARLRLVPQRAVQPQPVPRAGRLLPADGLAGGAEPAGPRPGLGGRPGCAAGRRAWAQLDREGRLVALYGVLAVFWLVIAVNLAYRIYADRVAGLVIGLWRGGFAGPDPAARGDRGAGRAAVVRTRRLARQAGAGWRARQWRERQRGRGRSAPARRAARLGAGAAARVRAQRLAAEARWVRPAHRRAARLRRAPRSPRCTWSSTAPWRRAARAIRAAWSGSGSARAAWSGWPARSPARRRRWPGTPPAPRCCPLPASTGRRRGRARCPGRRRRTGPRRRSCSPTPPRWPDSPLTTGSACSARARPVAPAARRPDQPGRTERRRGRRGRRHAHCPTVRPCAGAP